MTSENNDNFSSHDLGDDFSEYNDDLLSNINMFETDKSHLNARRKIENYYDKKILLNHLKDTFTDDLD
jgi:hypothetical protein